MAKLGLRKIYRYSDESKTTAVRLSHLSGNGWIVPLHACPTQWPGLSSPCRRQQPAVLDQERGESR